MSRCLFAAKVKHKGLAPNRAFWRKFPVVKQAKVTGPDELPCLNYWKPNTESLVVARAFPRMLSMKKRVKELFE